MGHFKDVKRRARTVSAVQQLHLFKELVLVYTRELHESGMLCLDEFEEIKDAVNFIYRTKNYDAAAEMMDGLARMCFEMSKNFKNF